MYNFVFVHVWYIYVYIYIDSVLRKIKNRKTAVLDEIPLEVWKTRQFDDILLRLSNAVYNQNPIDRWMKGSILPFPKKRRPRITQELPGYNTYIHSSQNIQCPTTQPHRTHDWTKMASGEIDPWLHKYWLSVEFLKAYRQKIYRWQYYLSALQRPLILLTEGRWSKFYSDTVYQKKPLQP